MCVKRVTISVNTEKWCELQCFTKVCISTLLNTYFDLGARVSFRTLGSWLRCEFDAFLASCKVLLNLSAIRHFDDP